MKRLNLDGIESRFQFLASSKEGFRNRERKREAEQRKSKGKSKRKSDLQWPPLPGSHFLHVAEN